MGSVRSVGGRMSWGLIDQALSSLSNFAVGIVVAHNFGLEEFGAFTLAWFTYGLILNISRGLGTDPLVVRFSGVPTASLADRRLPHLGHRHRGRGRHGCGLPRHRDRRARTDRGRTGRARPRAPPPRAPGQLAVRLLRCRPGPQGLPERPRMGLALSRRLAVAVQRQSLLGLVLAWGSRAVWRRCSGFWQARVAPSLGRSRIWPASSVTWGVRYLVENVMQSGGTQLRMYAPSAPSRAWPTSPLCGGALSSAPCSPY